MLPRDLFPRLARLSLKKLLLLLEAAFWLCLARLALRVLPFPRIGRYIGHLQKPSPLPLEPSAVHAATARRIAQAVNATAVNSPVEMVCLPRALAAWQMLHLRKVPSRLHFGAPLVRKSGIQARETHAWLSSAGVEVTGYPVAHGCVELGYFAREAGPGKDDVDDTPRC